MSKVCNGCNEDKDFSLFSKSRFGKYGYRSKCKPCNALAKKEAYKKKKEAGLYDFNANKNNMLKKLYGIELSTYNEMLENQKHSCSICGVHVDLLVRNLAVDHCHATNKVRGLLCHHCNTAIGLLKDNTEILKNAISYLEHHKSKD